MGDAAKRVDIVTSAFRQCVDRSGTGTVDREVVLQVLRQLFEGHPTLSEGCVLRVLQAAGVPDAGPVAYEALFRWILRPPPLVEGTPLQVTLQDATEKLRSVEASAGKLQPAVIVLTGAFNPLHVGHIEMMKAAVSGFERDTSFAVVAVVVQPSSDKRLAQKLSKVDPSKRRVHRHISFRTRCQLAELGLSGEKGICVLPEDIASSCSSAASAPSTVDAVTKAFQDLLAKAASAKVPELAPVQLAGMDNLDEWIRRHGSWKGVEQWEKDQPELTFPSKLIMWRPGSAMPEESPPDGWYLVDSPEGRSTSSTACREMIAKGQWDDLNDQLGTSLAARVKELAEKQALFDFQDPARPAPLGHEPTMQELLDAFSVCDSQQPLGAAARADPAAALERRADAVARAAAKKEEDVAQLLPVVRQNLSLAGDLSQSLLHGLERAADALPKWKFDKTGRVDNPPLVSELSAAAEDEKLKFTAQELNAIRHIYFPTFPVEMTSQTKVDAVAETVFGSKPCGFDEPVALIMAGAPGSGKSYMANLTVQKVQDSRPGTPAMDQWVHIDPDHWISNLCDSNNTYRPLANFQNHMSLMRAINQRYCIFFDGTGKDPLNTCGRVISRMKQAKYRIYMAVVLADFKVCMARVKKRAEETGRDVPQFIVESIFDGLKDSAPLYLDNHKSLADTIFVYNNMGSPSQPREPSLDHTINSESTQEQVDKAKEQVRAAMKLLRDQDVKATDFPCDPWKLPEDFKHIKARSAHPKLQRTPVSDDLVSWKNEWKDYAPVSFSDESLKTAPWADVLKPEKDREELAKRHSFEGSIQLEEETGYPINPRGRTGLRERGILGRWGPNHAADPLVTREDPETGRWQVIVVERRDECGWALPGGMVDPGEKVSITVKREFSEEAGNFTGDEEAQAAFNKLVDELFDSGVVVYQGYVDDPRNTDNAWMETTAFHFHCSKSMGEALPLKAGDDAKKVKWLFMDTDEPLYANHRHWVDFVRARLDGTRNRGG